MNTGDTWARGEAYEPYVGRWSRMVAGKFLDWLTVQAGGVWLDVGCGTGVLTEAIVKRTPTAAVIGIDPAEGFVAYARDHVQDSRVSFGVGNAMALPFADDAFDAVVSGLALNFVPRPDVGLDEMVRSVRGGGIVAAYVWDYADQMEMMRAFWDAAVELDPALSEQDEGRRFPICRPEPLTRLFESAGLSGVEVRAIDVATRFRDFDDYWLPFLGGQGPAAGYATALAEGARTTLRELIRSRLPVLADGSISLIARAWAVRGNK